MKEISRICDKEGKNKSKVIYNFETEILQGQNLSYSKSMGLKEYKKIKENTIKQAKIKGWNLTFEIVK